MKELYEWLLRANDAMEYGDIDIHMTYHQGQLLSMEKKITHKTKFAKVKKTENEGENGEKKV